MVDMDKMRRSAGRDGNDIDEISDMLADIDNASGVEFTDWELEFIESITDQLSEGRTLTELQLESLQEIWNKV